ncbi:hypothetical protein ACN082_07525 [Rothia sp. CCM 9417]|uniref:hypothetical protein n=1 Tax=unclassified Rothia (in: high G+C Gram-positive bacteria) TaxID=2689056 RepID=UPI003AE93319
MPVPVLEFEYSTLQTLIDTFKATKESFEGFLESKAPTPASAHDPVAEHHAAALGGQESSLLSDAAESFQNAQDGAQAAYDAFKIADGAEG